MLKKKLLCTLGPASFNAKTICRLEELGVYLFRINLSHTNLEDLEERICFIRNHSEVPICLDTEGAQIRSKLSSSEQKLLQENEIVSIGNLEKTILPHQISLYPHFVINELVEGDLLSIDFDTALLQIISSKDGVIQARVLSSGWVGNNKAVNLLRPIILPAFTPKDEAAIEIGMRMDIKHFALSFANCKEDVESLREMTQGKAQIISKIESRNGYKNLDKILAVSDAILIDRGDLSREIPIELIPFYQKKIIKHANYAKKPVYIATNLLESMIEKPYPTRAEVNDVINALMMGADGLVLAAETAIGKRPIESATMVIKLINQFNLSQSQDVTEVSTHVASMLVEPHGGQLIRCFDENSDWEGINHFKKLKVPDSVIMDAEQIGIGTYSPLKGFMTKEEIHSVLDSYRLPNGLVWTLPIVLQKDWKEIRNLRIGQTLALASEIDNEIYATLKIKDIYRFPFEKICHKWFGTLNLEHPGVQRLKSRGDCFVGGEITLLKRRRSSCRIYEFTPEELRHIFISKGWNRVVGFHTRNVIHRGHEAIQRMALEKNYCDGLLISPVVGEKKKGDFTAKILLDVYQLMIDRSFYPKDKVFIGAFSTYSRYSGAREAVFTALCRKNFGCSHFIVGRDHTGVGNFYTSHASQELFKQLGDIGITPMFFDEIQFCPLCAQYVSECPHDASDRYSISGTQIRNHFSEGKSPPNWLMREEISEMILDKIYQGKEIFVP